MKLIIFLVVLFVVSGCGEGFVEKKPYKLALNGGSTSGSGDETGGTTGGTSGGPSDGSDNGGGTSGNGGGNSGNSTGGNGGGGKNTPPPNEKNLVKSIASQNPGMINDCTGRPIANNFLIYTVQALQKKDPRWGYMIKSGGKKVPRDIVAYAWGGPKEGTRNFYVVDFVASGCNNSPSNSNFTQPALAAKPFWKVHNADSGYASNGTWSADP